MYMYIRGIVHVMYIRGIVHVTCMYIRGTSTCTLEG